MIMIMHTRSMIIFSNEYFKGLSQNCHISTANTMKTW